mgnify:CR=1 FL=1
MAEQEGWGSKASVELGKPAGKDGVVAHVRRDAIRQVKR